MIKQYRIQWQLENGTKMYGGTWRNDDGKAQSEYAKALHPGVRAWVEWRTLHI
jgi:hypothetical protein